MLFRSVRYQVKPVIGMISKRTIIKHRRSLVVAIHLFLIPLANYLAFWLRFDGIIPDAERQLMIQTMPWLLLVRAFTFLPFRLYAGLWRYTGIWDLRNIILGVLCSTILFYFLVHGPFGLELYPRSVFITDALLLIFLMGGLRMLRRLHQVLPALKPRTRVLIYGAGDAGEMIVRDMKSNARFYKYKPIGLVDDDPNKIGRRIHGIPVLGNRRQLQQIIAKKQPQEVIFAMPSAEREILRELVKSLQPLNVVLKTLPNLREIKNGQVNLSQIRALSMDDLLDRMPVGLDLEPVRNLIKGKRILITGAGGSIGSELSRQIATYDPEMLVLLDKSETALFGIDTELGRKYPSLKKSAALVDIKHKTPLREVFRQYSPQLVLHAAAYKHVPMMEYHPGEAVLNNIVGTCRLTHVAIEYKAEKFVLISTDKAVNPTNVMGATKRVAELYIDALESNVRNAQTRFSAVRFGNVLDSSGSVVPLFRQQIENGGPVTVTHPEVTRYFMTIPEAVQLVLRASTLTQGGEIFVLDMGQPVKLVDMARNLIRSAGLAPDKDIKISFVGLRPGEKLHEELVAADEKVEPTEVDKILKIRPSGHIDQASLIDRILEMEKLAVAGRAESLIKMLCAIVPNFKPFGVNGNNNGDHRPNEIGMETATTTMQKILVVDDHEDILETLGHQLTEAGWQVVLAKNGKEALQKLETYRPNVIVLDMMMPEMDGFQVARSVKQNPDYKDIRIVAATTLCSRADRDRCLAAGCDDYVTKPFTLQELQRHLTHLTDTVTANAV